MSTRNGEDAAHQEQSADARLLPDEDLTQSPSGLLEGKDEQRTHVSGAGL